MSKVQRFQQSVQIASHTGPGAKGPHGRIGPGEMAGLQKQYNSMNPAQKGASQAWLRQEAGRPGLANALERGPGAQGPKGPQQTTDKDGNTVTKTPDGYVNVESADGNKTTTLTPGGYEVTYDKEASSLTMKDLKSGESTTVWGDPHVSESDESGSFWNYDSSTSTFMLPDGTKITTEATSADGTLTDVDIYSGTGRSHFSASVENGNSIAADRFRADAAQDDGDVYFGNLRVNDWYAGTPLGEEVQSDYTGYEGLPYFDD